MTDILEEPTRQSLAKPEIIVCKTLISPAVAKLTVEKLKSKVFTKFGFLTFPSWQIQQLSMEKDYDIYVIVDGKYTLDYYRKRNYKLEVDGKVQEVMIFYQPIKPEPTRDPYKKTLKLEALERITRQSKACIILNSKGREIPPTQVPCAPSEEHPEEVLAEFEKVKPLKPPPSNGIDLLQSRIAKRPSEIERIEQETFEIVEHAVIYAPVYKARLQNRGTGEQKTIRIDGVTGELRYW